MLSRKRYMNSGVVTGHKIGRKCTIRSSDGVMELTKKWAEL